MTKLFFNGKIIDTRDFQIYESLALSNETIVKKGPFSELQALYPNAHLIDLEGAVLMPAFNDSHMHLLGYGQALFNVELSATNDFKSLVETCKTFLIEKNIGAGQWLLGRGWNQDRYLEGQLPNRQVLDLISTEHPIFLRRACGHIGVANTLALKTVGLWQTAIESAKGGAIDLDSEGLPTGVLRENAMNLLLDQIPTPDDDTLTSYILEAQNALFSGGITSVQSDDLCVFPIEDSSRILRLFESLGQSGRLKIALHEQSLMRTNEHLQWQLTQGYLYGKSFGRFSHGPLKILGDGSLGARTAFLNAPYTDDPSTTGIAMYTQEALNAMVYTAFKANLPVAIHGIGDGMIDMAIEAIVTAQSALNLSIETLRQMKNAIVHCQITTRRQLERMASLGIIGMVQPIFLDYDIHIVEQRVGQERASESYAFRTMESLGMHTCYGTDCPVEGFNVFNGIQCALTRRDLKHRPSSGWHLEEAVTIQQALRAYTCGGAYASNEAQLKGCLDEGMLADLVVLDQDPCLTPPEHLSQIKILETYKSGELVYSCKQ